MLANIFISISIPFLLLLFSFEARHHSVAPADLELPMELWIASNP